MSTALIPFVPSQTSETQPDQTFETRTVFDQFLEHIERIHPHPCLTTIILSGISPIMGRLAQIEGRKLETTKDYEELSILMNNLVEIGIILKYKTPEIAAHAFCTTVLRLVEDAQRHGYRPGITVSAEAWNALAKNSVRILPKFIPRTAPAHGLLTEYWQTPCSNFFAPIVKTARASIAYWSQQARDLNVRNTYLDRGTSPVFLCDQEMIIRGIEQLVDDLPVKEHCVSASVYTFDKDLRRGFIIVNMMRSLNVRVSRDACEYHTFIDEVWISTQILLAQLGKTRESLENIPQALLALEVFMGDSSFVDRTIKHLEKRRSRAFADDERCELEKMVCLCAQHMRSWKKSVYVNKLCEECFIETIDLGAWMSDDIAYTTATGDHASIANMMRRSGKSRTEVIRSIVQGLRIRDYQAHDILNIFKVGIIPFDHLLDRLKECDQSTQDEVVHTLFEDQDLSKQAFLALKTRGYVHMSVDVLLRHHNLIDETCVDQELFEQLSTYVREEDSSHTNTEKFVRIFSKASKKVVQTFLQDNKRKSFLGSSVKLTVGNLKSNDQLLFDLQKKMGDVYEMMALCIIAGDRALDRKEDSRMIAWKNLLESLDGEQKRIIMSVPENRRNDLFQRISEKKALTWATDE